MPHHFSILLIGFLLATSFGCGDSASSNENPDLFDSELAEEIIHRAQEDQQLREAIWHAYSSANLTLRDSLLYQQGFVVSKNCYWVQDVMEEHGYPGIDLVGEAASHDFGLLLQCEHDETFQQDMLQMMKAQMERGQVNPADFASVTDRIRINQGEAQLYGTQVIHDQTGQAVPYEIYQTDSVEARRAAIGLDSLHTFLRRETDLYRETNREYYQRLGLLPN